MSYYYSGGHGSFYGGGIPYGGSYSYGSSSYSHGGASYGFVRSSAGGYYGGYHECPYASPAQIAEATIYRTHTDKSTFKELSKIVHSADQNPHKYGYNLYADKTLTYDPRAQVVIDNAKAKFNLSNKFPSASSKGSSFFY